MAATWDFSLPTLKALMIALMNSFIRAQFLRPMLPEESIRKPKSATVSHSEKRENMDNHDYICITIGS